MVYYLTYDRKLKLYFVSINGGGVIGEIIVNTDAHTVWLI